VGVPLPVPTCTDSAPTRASTNGVPLMRHRAPPLTALRPRSVSCSNVKALMEEVLETEAREGSGVSAELERSVRAHAASMRDAGFLPEDMIIALRLIAARGPRRILCSRADHLYDRMVCWSLREFFCLDL